MRLLPCLIAVSLLAGCGGFRSGIQSIPYIDAPEPHIEPSHPSWPHEIVLPEFILKLSLNNVLRTYQYEVMLFFVPTYFNFWDEFRNRDATALELTFQVVAHDSPLTLNPHELSLTVDGREVRPNSVRVNNPERERQVLNTYIKARRQAPQGQALTIPHPSEWQDAIDTPISLSPKEKSPRFIVTFPLPLLSPDKELVLDISRAIPDTRSSNVPPIRFQSKPWSEGYS
jgi:hypothetical protein